MNIRDAHNIKQEIKERRKAPLKVLLEQIEYKMKTAIEMDFDEVSYLIPAFIIGKAPYTIKDAVTYLKTKLENRGFTVTAEGPRLLVSWSAHTQVKEKKHVNSIPKPRKSAMKKPRVTDPNQELYAALHEFANPAKM
jgi:hypothetical protein